MKEGDELQELLVLTQDERQLYHILRAVSSSLALVFSMFVFMVSLVEETCIFAIVLLDATIQDGGICEGDQSRALQEIPQFELCYRMGYNSPPGDSLEN